MFQLKVKNYFCRVKSGDVSCKSLIKGKKQLFSYIFQRAVSEEGIIEGFCLQTGCISSPSFNEKHFFAQSGKVCLIAFFWKFLYWSTQRVNVSCINGKHKSHLGWEYRDKRGSVFCCLECLQRAPVMTWNHFRKAGENRSGISYSESQIQKSLSTFKLQLVWKCGFVTEWLLHPPYCSDILLFKSWLEHTEEAPKRLKHLSTSA